MALTSGATYSVHLIMATANIRLERVIYDNELRLGLILLVSYHSLLSLSLKAFDASLNYKYLCYLF